MTKPICSIVTGNSNSGSSCINELIEKYQNSIKVRAVFRTENKAKSITNKHPTLEYVIGVDASKKESLSKAFEGAEYAMIITVHDPNRGYEEDANLTLNLINSAVDRGVKYIVLVSSFTVAFADKIPIIAGRFKPVEERLAQIGKEKGLKWTILRGGCFMDNLGHALGQIKSGGDTFNFPKCNVPFVDTTDIGRSAAACLASNNIDEHNEKIYSMNGPELFTGEAIADCISNIVNKKIKYIETPKDAYHKFMPEGVAQIFDHFGEMGKNAAPFTNDIKQLTGQNAYLNDFIERSLKSDVVASGIH